jgi:hypothetical protein
MAFLDLPQKPHQKSFWTYRKNRIKKRFQNRFRPLSNSFENTLIEYKTLLIEYKTLLSMYCE